MLSVSTNIGYSAVPRPQECRAKIAARLETWMFKAHQRCQEITVDAQTRDEDQSQALIAIPIL